MLFINCRIVERNSRPKFSSFDKLLLFCLLLLQVLLLAPSALYFRFQQLSNKICGFFCRKRLFQRFGVGGSLEFSVFWKFCFVSCQITFVTEKIIKVTLTITKFGEMSFFSIRSYLRQETKTIQSVCELLLRPFTSSSYIKKIAWGPKKLTRWIFLSR